MGTMGIMALNKVAGIAKKDVKEAIRSGLVSIFILAPLLLLLVIPSPNPSYAVVGCNHSLPSELSSSSVYFVASKSEALDMQKNGKISAILSFKDGKAEILAENSYYGIETADKIQNSFSNSKIFYHPPLPFLSLAFLAQLSGLLLASISISKERETGTLRMLVVSRFNSFEIILGKLTAVLAIALIPLFLGVTILSVFSITVSIGQVLFLLFLLLASSSTGIVLSSAFTQDNALILATLLLSANAFAMFYFPDSLYLLPLTQAQTNLESIPFLILYSLIALIFSLIIFRNRRGEAL